MTINNIPAFPICGMKNTYPDGNNFICPDCSHDRPAITTPEEFEEKRVYKDIRGNILSDGDTVTLIKDLKVKGSLLAIKGVTKIKNICLVDGDHDFDCKVNRQSILKSEFMKKA